MCSFFQNKLLPVFSLFIHSFTAVLLIYLHHFSSDLPFIPLSLLSILFFSLCRWYYGNINRVKAEKLLLASQNKDGSFLVRISESHSDEYTISGKCQNLFIHPTPPSAEPPWFLSYYIPVLLFALSSSNQDSHSFVCFMKSRSVFALGHGTFSLRVLLPSTFILHLLPLLSLSLNPPRPPSITPSFLHCPSRSPATVTIDLPAFDFSASSPLLPSSLRWLHLPQASVVLETALKRLVSCLQKRAAPSFALKLKNSFHPINLASSECFLVVSPVVVTYICKPVVVIRLHFYEWAHSQFSNGPHEICDFKACCYSVSLESPPAQSSLRSSAFLCLLWLLHPLHWHLFPSTPLSSLSLLSTLPAPPSSRSFSSRGENTAVTRSIFTVLVFLKYASSVLCVHMSWRSRVELPTPSVSPFYGTITHIPVWCQS